MTIRKFSILMTLMASCSLSACGGGNSAPSPKIVPPANQVAVTVEQFNVNNPFPNRPYVTVTVCNNSNECQDIDHVLLDTGSSGLRIMPGILNISLPSQKDSSGNQIAECMQYGAGYFWGAQRLGTLKMAGETANNIPMTIAGDGNIPGVAPSGCADTGPNAIAGAPEFKGILGIGPQQADCGTSCAQSAQTQMYFSCTGGAAGSCTPVAMPIAMQTPNPVIKFSSDNNGTVIAFPQVTSPQATLTGTLTFGIGTQQNNVLSSQKVYIPTVNNVFFQSLAGDVDGNASFAFLDSGTNAYSLAQTGTPGILNAPPFLQSISGLSVCGQPGGPFCPSSPSLIQMRLNGFTGNPVSWQTITLADPTAAFNSNFAVIPTLGFQNNNFPGYSILGLPFFYGRAVATAIEGAGTPYGVGPYWAF